MDEFRRNQPIEELKRKAKKAIRKQNIWTIEELEWHRAEAKKLAKEIGWEK